MKQISLITLLALTVGLSTTAQTININAVLRSIADNNKSLKALKQANAANISQLEADNTLGATSVEYSPFFRKGVSGTSSSELIVSQEFKLPNVYASQRKAITLQRDVDNKAYDIALRDIMTEAQAICYDLQSAMQNATLLKQRRDATDSLLTICYKQLSHGNATIMDINRVKLDSMSLQSDLITTQTEISQARIALIRLGAGEEALKANDNVSPATNAIDIPKSAELRYADATLTQANQELKVSKQGWLPTLTVGYRRNTELHEASNGPLIGMAIPLFSNSRKIKAARMKQSAAQLAVEDATYQLNAQRQALQSEARSLELKMQTYDLSLMQQSLKTLMRAVSAGELSISEYYLEANKIYTIMQEKITVENRYNKVRSQLEAL